MAGVLKSDENRQGGRWSVAWLAIAAAPVAAVAGCLQPAIDPVFLTLLSTATPVPAASHGWIVGATQGSAALGALGVWQWSARLPRRMGVAAGAMATLCAGLTPVAWGLGAVLALRAGYGLAMGALYALAMSSFAARRPSGSYATVLLAQSLVATLVSLALPAVAGRGGADLALGLLVLVPGVAMLAIGCVERPPQRSHASPPRREPAPRAAWALAWAIFWFISATMMVWSLSGALAMRAGLSEAVIGEAVALGSLAAAATALAVMRERMVVPLWLSAILASGGLLAPLVLTRPQAPYAFVLAMVLFNIGFTVMSIRCSGLATAIHGDGRFRVLVAAMHNVGMAAGPILGSVAIWAAPGMGLLLAAGFAVAAGVASVVVGYCWALGLPGGGLRRV